MLWSADGAQEVSILRILKKISGGERERVNWVRDIVVRHAVLKYFAQKPGKGILYVVIRKCKFRNQSPSHRLINIRLSLFGAYVYRGFFPLSAGREAQRFSSGLERDIG